MKTINEIGKTLDGLATEAKMIEDLSSHGQGLVDSLCALARDFNARHGHLYRIYAGELAIWVSARNPAQALSAAYEWLCSADYEDFEVSNVDQDLDQSEAKGEPFRIQTLTGDQIDLVEAIRQSKVEVEVLGASKRSSEACQASEGC